MVTLYKSDAPLWAQVRDLHTGRVTHVTSTEHVSHIHKAEASAISSRIPMGGRYLIEIGCSPGWFNPPPPSFRRCYYSGRKGHRKVWGSEA